MKTHQRILLVAAPLLMGVVSPLSSHTTAPRSTAAHPNNLQQPQMMVSRAAFLSTAATSSLVLLGGGSAHAATVDPAIKGTKNDPAFQACLSQCMYDCTKPKGAEQKSRTECLPECKQKCATTKAQLLKGTPVVPATAGSQP